MKRVLAGLLMIIVAGCTAASPSPAPTLPAALADRTPWQAEMTNLEPNGTRSLESALTLFAMAFGPIPGVQVSNVEGTVGSASPAVRAVMAHRDQLTDEQRAAIDGYLTGAENGIEVDVPTATSGMTATVSSAAGPSTTSADLLEPFENDLLEIAKRARAQAAYYFGEIPDVVGVGGGPAVSIRFMNQPEWNFSTFHVPTFGETQFLGCKVFVNTAFATSIPQTNRALTLDVTHCYQSWRLGTDQGFDGQVPAWAWDGPAEYIMLESLPPQEDDVLWWATYLLLPEVSLFERSYDAVGFYTQARDAGVDLGEAFAAVLTDVDNPERFALAGTTTNEFLDQWASGHVLDFGWGDDWEFNGPGQPGGVIPPRQSMSISNGSLEAYSQDAYGNHLFAAHSTADIVKVEVFGRARVGDGQVDVVVPGTAVFCTTEKGCGPCPDGSDPPIERTQLSPNFVLAVGGGTDGTNGTVSGHPLEEFCQQTPSPPATPNPTPDSTPDPDPDPDPGDDACSNGCPMSNGDPHMISLNGVPYDFMAAGEFVLLRSADGSFELQSRQEPVEGSTYVSGNTALAMRVGTNRVAIFTDVSTNELSATIDGNAVDLASAVAVGGGKVSKTIDGVEVTFPDGSRLMAHGSYEFGISMGVIPSDALRASAAGLLGAIPEGLFTLPALPDGSFLPRALSFDEYQQQVYGPFEDAWRITQATSLFDYTPGTTTESYTLPDFPVFEDMRTLDDFSEAELANAGAACAGLDNETLTLQCIYDVIVTGNEGFGEVYEQTATIVDTGALSSSGARARVVNLYSENGQPVDLDVYAWAYSEATTTEVAALVATVPFGQASDWFNPGLIQAPYSDSPYTKVTVERRGEAPDQINPLAGMSEFLGPGTVTTLSIWQEELFDDQPDAWIEAIYAEHPTYEVPRATAGNAALVSRNHGLLAGGDDSVFLYFGSGEGCLESPFGRTFPEIPNAQPVGNPVVLPVGPQTLTLHDAPFGEVPTCTTKALGPGASVNAEAGDRLIAFPYRLPGAAEISLLVVPFD